PCLRLRQHQLARGHRDRVPRADGGDDLDGSRILLDPLPSRAAAGPPRPLRGRAHGECQPLADFLAHHLAAGDADHAVRRHQRADQCVPRRRPGHRHDRWRAEQHDHLAVVLRLPGRVLVLGFRLCRRALDGAVVRAGRGCAGAILLCRSPDSLPMTSAAEQRQSVPVTLAAWLFGLVWALPLLYALWAGFHTSAYATRFDLTSPLTLANFVRAWEAAPFARYFLNTLVLVLGIMAGQFVICTLAAFGLARWKFFGSEVLFALI